MGMKILSGNSNPELAEAIAAYLNIPLTKADVKRFSDEEIWDIGAIAAFFAMSNRLANLTSMRPNDEFFSMAR